MQKLHLLVRLFRKKLSGNKMCTKEDGFNFHEEMSVTQFFPLLLVILLSRS